MNSFKNTFEEMIKHRMKVPAQRVFIRIPDARAVLEEALAYFLSLEGRQLRWLPEYDYIACWLSDNAGKGLFMYGNCGRGKSLLSRYVLPAIMLRHCRKVVSVFDIQDMNRDIDLVMSKMIISLDDIGTEEATNRYGNKRLAFAEIMDSVEKYNKLAIISTNLQAEEIKRQYGDRILDRILSTTTRVLFQGESMRK